MLKVISLIMNEVGRFQKYRLCKKCNLEVSFAAKLLKKLSFLAFKFNLEHGLVSKIG